MQISIRLNPLIDDICADSALMAILRLRDPNFATSLLTPDHRRPIIRLLTAAAAHVTSLLTSHIQSVTFPKTDDTDPTLTLTLTDQTDAQPDMILNMIQNAIVLSALHHIALQTADYDRADRYSERLTTITDAITSAISSVRNIPQITPYP